MPCGASWLRKSSRHNVRRQGTPDFDIVSEATHIRTFKRVSDNLTALNPIDNLSASTIAAYGDEFNMSTSPIISL